MRSITTTRPLFGRKTVEHPLNGTPIPAVAWMVRHETGESLPLVSTKCAVCGCELFDHTDTADLSRVWGDSRYGYEMECGPRTPFTCSQVPDMAYFDGYGKVNAPETDEEDTLQPIIKRGTKARSVESQERYDRGRKPKDKRHYRKAGA